ncbi:hypothetical protein [Actinomadura parmotrematis]|uniref:Uncharacterized protein n=1 Tax=Actinomadura parmotrematis TaxID=2864039 RepID=A0ABS7FPU4_9ACTN|nr:hypothetical protein [Actinomadura parmotrematis]MBW8482420.1 hypothetical protein [Actinomadura parmotrematis]
MTEAAPGDGHMIGALLAVEGHQVAFCHPPGTATGPCAAMARGGRCPLRERPVDVVVDVRIGGEAARADGLGAGCAVRSGVPLLVAGTEPPAADVAERALFACGPEDVVAACAGYADGRAARSAGGGPVREGGPAGR